MAQCLSLGCIALSPLNAALAAPECLFTNRFLDVLLDFEMYQSMCIGEIYCLGGNNG